MRFATLADGSRDGRLILLSQDNERYVPAVAVPTLQALLDNWTSAMPALATAQEALDAGKGTAFDPALALAPLPRAWQWLDASAFPSHGALMDQVLGIAPAKTGRPLMYQGLSDHFLAPTQNVPFGDAAHGIDFEGEFGVIIDEVPMGASVSECGAAIRLIVQINDWSLRMLAGPEMKTGFGWVQAKPACSMAPVALTPDELGDAWRDYRVHLTLVVDWNGKRFGRAHGGTMEWSFAELIAHAAGTRRLAAGTIIGSGTVSNENFRIVGSSCIAERRGIEIIDNGRASTEFMAFGDHILMEARSEADAPLFGAIDQHVIAA